VINRAKAACEETGNTSNDWFIATNKPVKIGSGAARYIKDYHLTRDAVLLLQSLTANKTKSTKQGFVYLLAGNGKYGSGLYKIGKAEDIRKRISDFRVLPFDLILLHQFQSDNALLDEARLHSIFALKRVKGEWFELSDSDLIWFKSLPRGWKMSQETPLSPNFDSIRQINPYGVEYWSAAN
jgi:hypothetical protein